MIEFSRYSHVNDLILHYSEFLSRKDIKQLVENGIRSEDDAEAFSKFIWEMVGQMNEDEEQGVEVLGCNDNSEMLPDVSYEVTKLMKKEGYFHIWEKISNDEMK